MIAEYLRNIYTLYAWKVVTRKRYLIFRSRLSPSAMSLPDGLVECTSMETIAASCKVFRIAGGETRIKSLIIRRLLLAPKHYATRRHKNSWISLIELWAKTSFAKPGGGCKNWWAWENCLESLQISHIKFSLLDTTWGKNSSNNNKNNKNKQTFRKEVEIKRILCLHSSDWCMQQDDSSRKWCN